jgi:hypothetical protein
MRTRVVVAVLAVSLLTLVSSAVPVPEDPPNTNEQADRFVDNGDGTVTDTKNKLMWAAKSSSTEMRSDVAEYYCGSFRAAGRSDWRMPTIEELKGLYDVSYSRVTDCYDKSPIHITPLISLSCTHVWAATERGSHIARFFFFNYGYQSDPRGPTSLAVALPVRKTKK